jgi:hypothetical protein
MSETEGEKRYRSALEGFFAHEWGATDSLAEDHPYKSSAPTEEEIEADLDALILEIVEGITSQQKEAAEVKEDSSPSFVHIFRCPGPYEREGVRYSLKSHEEGKDVPDGWFLELSEAVEAAGEVALIPPPKNTARKLKMAGLTPSKPVAPAEEVEESTEPKEDDEDVQPISESEEVEAITDEEEAVEKEGETTGGEDVNQEGTGEEANDTDEKEEVTPRDDGKDFKRYEELTEEERKEIAELLTVENVDEKGIRDEYNIHHLTLKKLKSE